ncbi:heme peroxidase [Mycena filopes]|nr:heme peroxidase [Mycena filopes]
MSAFPAKGGGFDASPKSRLSRWIHSIKRIKSKWALTPEARVVKDFINAALRTNDVTDEHGPSAFMDGITLLSILPPGSPTAMHMADTAVTALYGTIAHPPIASMGYDHAFRHADGGGNNLFYPDIGRAGTPYARCVPGTRAIPATAWPDPGLVFDTLMRKRVHREHPAGFSSLMSAFAALVAHSLFQTHARDWSINATSSYLDLSPLYGVDQQAQDMVRDRRHGRGLLHPDVFAEGSLLPPAASALLVLFSRNHNYIADMLLKINERGRWLDPPDPWSWAQQDEEIFQTARLINCGHFKSVFIGDYMAGCLGLSEGILSPLLDHATAERINRPDGTPVQRGHGNQSSVEFSIIYKWHTITISPRDAEWTEETFARMFGAVHVPNLTPTAYAAALECVAETVDRDPTTRSFAGMRRRDDDGCFTDADLARILQDATEHPASAVRARGTPRVLRAAETLGMLQARAWGVCTMNELRTFLGLEAFRTFEEWNSDVAIAGAARRLYGHVDNLELYVGLQCEEPMPLQPGVRFACGYTLMRALLADAVALIRGDRFLTTDFTPANLTTWGYQDCQRDPRNGCFGGQLPKLLMRHLPRHYPFNSVYACFPFFTPSKMEHTLTVQNIVARYTFRFPAAAPRTRIVDTITGIGFVFDEPARFSPIHGTRAFSGNSEFFYGFGGACKDDPDQAWLMHALFPSRDALVQYRKWYRTRLIQTIKDRSWRYSGVSGNYIDVVKGVINATTVRWAAEYLCGLRLKNHDGSDGAYTEDEFYAMLTSLSTYAFSGIEDSENAFRLRSAAARIGRTLHTQTMNNVLHGPPKPRTYIRSANPVSEHRERSTTAGFLGRLRSLLSPPPATNASEPFLDKLGKSVRPTNQLVTSVIGLAVSSVSYARAAVNVVDFYLDDSRAHERHQIIQLIRNGDERSSCDEMLRGYVCEAMRLSPQCGGLWREVLIDTAIPLEAGHPGVEARAGDRVWLSFKNAYLNPADFPRPFAVDPIRSLAARNAKGCPGMSYAEQTITELVKVVFGLKNVRRAAGSEGRLARFTKNVNGTEMDVYLTADGTASRWPGSMHLVYDD